jgi:hypothetical protein
MSTLAELIRERLEEAAFEDDRSDDDIQINVRIATPLAVALDVVREKLAHRTRTSTAKFLLDAAILDALEQFGLQISRDGDTWTVIPAEGREGAWHMDSLKRSA